MFAFVANLAAFYVGASVMDSSGPRPVAAKAGKDSPQHFAGPSDKVW